MEPAPSIWGTAEDMKRKIVKYNEQLDAKYSQLLVDEEFTFDIRVMVKKLPDEVEDVRLIESNAFGANSLCGSALFHWVSKWEIWTGNSGKYPQRDCSKVSHRRKSMKIYDISSLMIHRVGQSSTSGE